MAIKPARVTAGSFAGNIMLVCSLGISIGCDPISALHGAIRTPVDDCPVRKEQAVVDAEVRLICRNLDERSAEPNPSRSDEKGEFTFYMASFGQFSQDCKVRVTKQGYRPFEAKLSELNYRTDSDPHEMATVRINVLLQRLSP
jgi:hypothetical protein